MKARKLPAMPMKTPKDKRQMKMPALPAMPAAGMANGGMVGDGCGPGTRSRQDYRK